MEIGQCNIRAFIGRLPMHHAAHAFIRHLAAGGHPWCDDATLPIPPIIRSLPIPFNRHSLPTLPIRCIRHSLPILPRLPEWVTSPDWVLLPYSSVGRVLLPSSACSFVIPTELAAGRWLGVCDHAAPSVGVPFFLPLRRKHRC